MKSFDRVAGVLAALAIGLAMPVCAYAQKAIDIGSETQLLLDDFIVQRSDLELTLHQPKKHGLIQNADGSPWDRGDVYHGNIVCRDSAGKFHMTYRYIWSDPAVANLHANIGNDKAHWFREAVAYATSEDGIRWTKPKLGLLEGPADFKQQKDYPFLVPGGTSKDNNLGCPFDFIYDLNAHGNIVDREKRFLLRVVRKDDTHPFAEAREPRMYFAADWPDFANDPHWKDKLTPIPQANLSPRGFKSLCGYDQQAREWFALAQDHLHFWIPRGGRDIARSASPDLVRWGEGKLVLPVAGDESKTPTDYIEYMDLTAYRVGGPQTGAWLGQLVVFHSDRSSPQFMMPGRDNVWRKGTTELRLVLSRDAGRTWSRVAGTRAWLPHHRDEHGFDRLLFYTHPVAVGDEQWFYYSAWDGDHLTFNRDGSLYEPGFVRTGRTARATQRRDGYVSRDAKEKPGELVTKLLRFRGDRLRVNANAAHGQLRVELQDDRGRALPGFSLADCRPLTGDGIAQTVQWNAGPNLKNLQGRDLHVRFQLTRASLYSFDFKN